MSDILFGRDVMSLLKGPVAHAGFTYHSIGRP